jgi:hypothetical protein
MSAVLTIPHRTPSGLVADAANIPRPNDAARAFDALWQGLVESEPELLQ